MANKYDAYYDDPIGYCWIIEHALKHNKRSLEQWTWGDPRWDGPSRLADYMVSLSFGSGEAYPKYETLERVLSADIPTIRKWLRKLEKVWRFFEQGKGGVWRPRYKTIKGTKETHQEFKARVLKKIQADVAVRRIIRDLTEKKEKWNDGKVHCVPRKMAPHSNEEFMKETGRSRPTITRCLLEAEHENYTVRFEGNGKGRKSIYVRPDDEEQIENHLYGYKRHQPKQGQNKMRGKVMIGKTPIKNTITPDGVKANAQAKNGQ
jgi:hypothetical protein